VHTRAKEYPNDLREDATPHGMRLWCDGCHEEVCEESSAARRHVKSDKHERNMAHMRRREEENERRAATLSQHFQRTNTEGEGLSKEQQVRRYNVVRGFLRGGVPLNKITPLRPVLEEKNPKLTTPAHMAAMVPFVREEELTTLREEVKGQRVSVIFDATTHNAEVLGVVLR
jgi:hypothetical protein